MKAVILAAGRGSRLMPYTKNVPKCLTELGGKPLIRHQMDALLEGGADDIVIVTGYMHEMLTPFAKGFTHNPDWASTNMVESLFCAEAHFDCDIIVSYSDIVFDSSIVHALCQSTHDISVIVDKDWRPYWEKRFENPLSDAESLRMDSSGQITEIGRPVTKIETIEAQYIGLMRFRGEGVTTLKRVKHAMGLIHRDWMKGRELRKADMTDLLMEIILHGYPVHAVCIKGGWLEIDNVPDLEIANKLFIDGKVRRGIPETAQ